MLLQHIANFCRMSSCSHKAGVELFSPSVHISLFTVAGAGSIVAQEVSEDRAENSGKRTKLPEADSREKRKYVNKV